MSHVTARDELFEAFAGVGKALSSGSRLRLIELLAQGPRGVMELAEEAGMNLTTASAHLQNLKRAGLVTARRSGTTIRYSLSSDKVAALFGQLCEVAAELSSEVDNGALRHFDTGELERIGAQELLGRSGVGDLVVLDVRPALEYVAGHIPGAISIPLDELPSRLEEIPDGVSVVVYCRGRYCLLSHDAVRLLSVAGRRVTLLEDGIVGWRRAGRPLSTAAA